MKRQRQIQTSDKLKELIFSGMVWVWLSLLDGCIIAYQFKVLLTDHLYLIMKHFYPNGSGLLQNYSSPIHRPWGLTEWFMEGKNDVNQFVICYGLHSHRISTQLNTYAKFWSDIFVNVLYHHHQILNIFLAQVACSLWDIFWFNCLEPLESLSHAV